MASNIAVSISADVTGLTAQLAVAKANLSSTTAELRNMAAQMRDAGSSASDNLKAGLQQAAAATASAQASVSSLRAQIQSAKPPLDELSNGYEHQSQIIREKLILAHEGLVGNYKRMVGSMVVLSERTGGLGAALGTLVTPTTLVGAAVALTVGAFVKAAAVSEEWAESFGEIKAAMDATGTSFGVSQGQITSYIDNLRQLHGVNTDTATEMVEMFARQRDIGTDSYTALGQAAAGYARVTGSDVPKAAQELVSALDGGYDSISKLDQRFSFLSTAQAQAIHDFDASGQKAQAMAVAIGALQAKFGPLVNDGLTPLQIGTNALKDSWQGLTQAIGESTWLKNFNTGLAVVELGLAKLINLLHGAKQEAQEFTASTASVGGTAGAAVGTVPAASSLPGIGSALGLGGGATGQATQTTALTANTTALTSLTTALTGHGAVVTANTTATTAGTAATTSNTASQTSNVVGNTVQTSTNTAAIAANTTALSSESAASGGGMFGKLLGFLPAFDVGSSNVPRDMVAQIHQGEMIVPAAHAADIRSGQSMLGGSRSMALPDGAAENMRAAGSDEAPASVGGNTYNSRSSGDVNLHYSPSINAHSNVDLSSVLAQQGSAMRRWLTNQMRNGSLKTQH